MNLRNYQAYSMAEALAAVKNDLGADAVILRTRSWKRGGILGIGRRTVFEITATTAAEAPPRRTAAAAPKTKARQAAGPSRRAVMAYRETTSTPDPEPSDRVRTQRLAQSILDQRDQGQRDQDQKDRRSPAELNAAELNSVLRRASRKAKSAPSATPLVSAPNEQARVERLTPGFEAAQENTSAAALVTTCAAPVAMENVAMENVATETAATQGRVARRFVLTSAAASAEAGVPVDPPMIETVPATAAATRSRSRPVPTVEPAASGPIEEELAAIRSMVGEVMRRQVTDSNSRPRGDDGTNGDCLPPALFDWYVRLIGQEISEELADRIVNQVRADLGDDGLSDPERVRRAVRQCLAAYIPTATTPMATQTTDGRPLTIALVGPTGVGKTTTLAKLAASFKLQHGRKVGMVTADTYRIAAVEQLRTYAEIIDLPLKVVQTPQEMCLAIQGLADCDVVLVDTAGRSQKDRGRIDELSAFIDAADPHEVHLVLSGTAGEKTLLQEAEAFGAVGVDRIVLSKLDETVSFGVLIDVVHRIGTELSFFTTGQEVPNHIEPSSPERLADLVLGESL